MSSLVWAADHAYADRQLDLVGSVGQLLLNLPLSRQLESVGRYYQALCLNRGGRGDTKRASALFEEVADNAYSRYRARAMLALGTNSRMVGDSHAAVRFYQEVMQIVTREHVSDPVTVLIAGRMTAVIKGVDGDHRGAIADLEKMLPLVRLACSLQPYAYYDYLNTLAVELGELGSLEQARRASEVALASPCASAYPEWRETFDDIVAKQQRASRSIVSVPAPIGETPRQSSASTWETGVEGVGETRNLVRMPASEGPTNASAAPQRSKKASGRVLSFEQWKALSRCSTAPLPGKLSHEQREEMTTGEKMIRLMDLISRDETDDEMIDRILEAVEEIVLGRP